MNDWQRIETAPVDGTHILLFDKETDDIPCIGFWYDTEWRDCSDMGCNGQMDYSPTHWMPLPGAPS